MVLALTVFFLHGLGEMIKAELKDMKSITGDKNEVIQNADR